MRQSDRSPCLTVDQAVRRAAARQAAMTRQARARARRAYHVTDAHGHTSLYTWTPLAEANASDPAVLMAIARLAIGQSLTVGGGAAPFVTVTRVR